MSILRARWLFPVGAPPIAGGEIAIREGRIEAVGRNLGPATDLGDVAIVPGLINAHTHLEFSELDQPLGAAGVSFPQWIRHVIAWRRARDEIETVGRQRRQEATERGLQESFASGVTTLGEIAAPGWPVAPFLNGAPTCIVFQELLGLAPERHGPLMDLAQQHLAAGRQSMSWRPALSPHAPYTAPFRLVEAAAELSQRSQTPLAMHLAESPEELELLQAGRGPFYDFLAEFSPHAPTYVPQGARPLDYLQRLAAAHRTLVVHGNYLDEDELGFLAERSATMTVVYCPRTHDYFGHSPYPLAEMLSRGVRVAIGTDSRGSNPDLNFWEELRFVSRRHSNVSPAEVLRLGTAASAEALGVAHDRGTLAVGRRADLAVVRLPQRSADDPHELLFDDEAQIAAVYFAGKRVE